MQHELSAFHKKYMRNMTFTSTCLFAAYLLHNRIKGKSIKGDNTYENATTEENRKTEISISEIPRVFKNRSWCSTNGFSNDTQIVDD